MPRPGRFRHQLLSTTFIQSDLIIATKDALHHFHSLWRSKKLQDWEWTAIYIVVLGLFHRPQDFLGGPHCQKDLPCLPGNFSLQDFFSYFEGKETPWKKKDFPQESFFKFICEHSLRSVPLAVNRSLAAWSMGRYPLDLREDIPSETEVLEMQIQGRRCVSVLVEPHYLSSLMEGRDALAFTVHDLIHADHFFSDPVQAKAQIEFLRRLKRITEIEFLKISMAKDKNFQTDWHYLVSDMNSVPLHLFKTLKAILLKTFKSQAGLPNHTSLDPILEQAFTKLLVEVGFLFDLNSAQTQAWLDLNNPHFQIPQQALCLSECLGPSEKEKPRSPFEERGL